MVALRCLFQLNEIDTEESLITHYNQGSGFVVVMTDDGESFKGYEYQIELIESD